MPRYRVKKQAPPPRGDKRAFIEAHPELKVQDVVARGKAQGLAFAPAYVYKVRSKALKARRIVVPPTNGNGAHAPVSAKQIAKLAEATRTNGNGHSHGNGAAQEPAEYDNKAVLFLQLIREMGTDRARMLWDEATRV